MLSYGTSLTTTGTGSLQRIDEEQLFDRIARPSDELQQLCAQLQQVQRVSQQAYDSMKRRLPFFCGSLFEEDHRKLERFQSAKYLVLDLDDCFRDAEEFAALRRQLCTDQRVMLLFTSPSGQGLKLMFSLHEPIRSAKEFSDFYQAFAHAFARDHEVEDYVDFKTHDATRVCFLCADAEAHYNRLVEDIDWTAYRSRYDLFRQENPVEAPAAGAATTPAEEGTVEKGEEEVLPDYRQILATLRPTPRNLRRPKEYVVPEVLETIVEPVNAALAGKDIEVEAVRDINYGKKWVLCHGIARGEVNVFYGKRGFSVVKSPKRGTHPQLNELADRLITSALYELEHAGLQEEELPGEGGPLPAVAEPDQDTAPGNQEEDVPF